MIILVLAAIYLIIMLLSHITSGSKYYDIEIMTMEKTFNNEQGIYNYQVYFKDSNKAKCEIFADEQNINFEVLIKSKSFFNFLKNIEYRKNMKKLCGILKYRLDSKKFDSKKQNFL